MDKPFSETGLPTMADYMSSLADMQMYKLLGNTLYCRD